MDSWLILPALLATVLSIGGLMPIAYVGHRKTTLASICEMAAKLKPNLIYFRFILWTCGTLFAITMYGWIVPRSTHAWLIGIIWTIEYIGDIMIAAIPARPQTMRRHLFFAQAMGYAMLALAYLFTFTLHGSAAHLNAAIAIIMTVLGLLTYYDKSRYVFYQAPFIYLSHITIIITALALR